MGAIRWLGGAENVTGFIETADMMINNYKFDRFEAGHLTRLEIVEDKRTHQEFIQDLQTTSQQVRQNISFGNIALVVGPSNPGYPWQSQIDLETSTASLNSKPGR